MLATSRPHSLREVNAELVREQLPLAPARRFRFRLRDQLLRDPFGDGLL
jgi:hypothetical protein